MTIKNLHINIVILVLGIFSLQSVGVDFFLGPFLITELEIEESTTEIDEIDFTKESSPSGSGNGGNAIISTQNPPAKSPFVRESNLLRFESKDLSQKPQLFILYCCLKLDC